MASKDGAEDRTCKVPAHYTTLRALREHNACHAEYNRALARVEGTSLLTAALYAEKKMYLPALNYNDDAPIPLIEILDRCGLSNAEWALRANLSSDGLRLAALYHLRSAERLAELYDKVVLDPRTIACNKMTRRWIEGKATSDEVWIAFAPASPAANDAGRLVGHYSATRVVASRAAAYAAAVAARGVREANTHLYPVLGRCPDIEVARREDDYRRIFGEFGVRQGADGDVHEPDAVIDPRD